MTPQQSIRIVSELASLFPARKLSAKSAENYARLLVDCDYIQTQTAIRELAKSVDFMPSVARIRATAISGMDDGSEFRGWAEVQSAIGIYGVYRSPQFKDPVAEYATACIGWQTICRCQESELGYLRHNWLEAYKSGRDRARRIGVEQLMMETNASGLQGLHEKRDPGLRGQSIGELADRAAKRLIGDGE